MGKFLTCEVNLSEIYGVVISKSLHKKMKFSIKHCFSKCHQTADLVTFTEAILN